MKYLLLALVYIYRGILRPFMGGRCRFYPSCSAYALEALKTHGALKGFYLTCKRLSKCHPFHQGGVDCVPKKRSRNL